MTWQGFTKPDGNVIKYALNIRTSNMESLTTFVEVSRVEWVMRGLLPLQDVGEMYYSKKQGKKSFQSYFALLRGVHLLKWSIKISWGVFWNFQTLCCYILISINTLLQPLMRFFNLCLIRTAGADVRFNLPGFSFDHPLTPSTALGGLVLAYHCGRPGVWIAVGKV